jgi:PTH1 family peptidyl-tRNA hydrolase
MKYLIVGLGNIGREYEGTRHNIGFEVVDYIAHQQNLIFQSDRYADTCKFNFKGRTLILVKPTTYMNLSGKAVRYHLEKNKIAIENLLVVVDDKDLPLGVLRLKPKGTGGSHNGINDIISVLNTIDFPRLRVGIGNDYPKGYQVEYVLGKFAKEEIEYLRPCVELSFEIIKNFTTQGIDRTMSLYNKRAAAGDSSSEN